MWPKWNMDTHCAINRAKSASSRFAMWHAWPATRRPTMRPLREPASHIDTVREKRSKTGYGINLEQALGKNVGLFLRASRAHGKTETYAFAEIDRSVSGGMDIKGGAWSRPNDNAGFAMVRNELSAGHRDYLRAGGLGFFLGDGRLDYGPEQIAEVYYSAALTANFWLSLNGQRIRNPGYNLARGPVSFYGLRMHIEF